MQRGELWWANLPDPVGSGPGYRRPVLIIQSDTFTKSRIKTIIVAVITKNLNLAQAPGNVLIPENSCGLDIDSVMNVSQVITIDKNLLSEFIGELAPQILAKVETGLRLVLDL